MDGRVADHLEPYDLTSEPLQNHDLDSPTWHNPTLIQRHQALKWLTELQAAGQIPMDRLQRFRNCGNWVTVHRHVADPNRWMLRGNFCRDRWCPTCAKARRRKVGYSIKHACRKASTDHPGLHWIFSTLTIAHEALDLATYLTHIRRCFHALTADPWWKHRVKGYVAVLEIKKSRDGTDWHVHLHLLIQGHFLEWATLRRKWLAITTTSHVVHVVGLKPDNAKKILDYICKYLTKPIDLARTTQSDRTQILPALHRKRLWSAAGTLRIAITEIRKADQDDHFNKSEWIPVATLTWICDRARRGDQQCRQLMARLYVSLESSTSHELPVPAPDEPILPGPP